jgi:hypothetical protein
VKVENLAIAVHIGQEIGAFPFASFDRIVRFLDPSIPRRL